MKMGTWGVGNFESDGALDYMGETIDAFVARIEECLEDEERSRLDEDGESVIVSTVAILSVLYEHCRAPAPEPDVVEQWKEQYLAIFDDQIDGLDPAEGYKEERREVIEETFDKLIGQARKFWKSDTST